MAEQKQHLHTSGFGFGQCRTKLRLCADIWPHLGDAFHLNHKGHSAPIPCLLCLRQLVKEDIHGAFIGLVVLSGLAGVDKLQQGDEVFFLRLRLIPDIADQGAV